MVVEDFIKGYDVIMDGCKRCCDNSTLREEEFVIKETDTREFFDDMDDEYIDEDKYSYRIAEDFDVDSYRKIYARIEQSQVGE